MKRSLWFSAAICIAMCAGFRTGTTKVPPSPSPRDIGSEVHGVFTARCAGCHGPELAKPEGRFGYVLDLRKLARNPEMVIPRQPAESELWVLVERDEMPPADSPYGTLTQAQKEVIREWIAAGTPDVSVASKSR